MLNNAAGANAVCQSCHTDGNNFTDQDGNTYTPPVVRWHAQNSGTGALLATCTDCHDAHKNRNNYNGGTNVSLVGISYDSNGNAQGNNTAQIADTNTANPQYPDDYYDVDFDSDRIFSDLSSTTDTGRICQVCHVAPPNRRHPPASSTGCVSCHTHTRGFMEKRR